MPATRNRKGSGVSDESQRQTGRTTRMLEAAAAHKRAGGNVTIVVSRLSSVKYFLRYPEAEGLVDRDFISVSRVATGARGRRAKVFVDNEVTDMGQDTEEFRRAIGPINDG